MQKFVQGPLLSVRELAPAKELPGPQMVYRKAYSTAPSDQRLSSAVQGT